MPVSINLLDRTPASRVVVDFGENQREFLDCHVAMDANGRAVHIWANGNRDTQPTLTAPLQATMIEWQRVSAAHLQRQKDGGVS